MSARALAAIISLTIARILHHRQQYVDEIHSGIEIHLPGGMHGVATTPNNPLAEMWLLFDDLSTPLHFVPRDDSLIK